jgi:hypothetical protein
MSIIIQNISKTPYLNICKVYGGAKINGQEYVYNPAKDALIRKDYTKHMRGKSWEQFVEFVKEQENDSSI